MIIKFLNTYECKGGHENRFGDMAECIKSMNTNVLTGWHVEAPNVASIRKEALECEIERLVYDAQTHIYEAIELLEKLDEMGGGEL